MATQPTKVFYQKKKKKLYERLLSGRTQDVLIHGDVARKGLLPLILTTKAQENVYIYIYFFYDFQFESLLTKTISFIQSIYQKITILSLVQSMDANDNLDLKEYWRGYSINQVAICICKTHFTRSYLHHFKQPMVADDHFNL